MGTRAVSEPTAIEYATVTVKRGLLTPRFEIDVEKLEAELGLRESVPVPDPFLFSGGERTCTHVPGILQRLGARTVSVKKQSLRELKFGEDLVGIYHVFTADPRHTQLEMQLKRLCQIAAVMGGFFHRLQRLEDKRDAMNEEYEESGATPEGADELRKELKLYQMSLQKLVEPMYEAEKADEFFRHWARFKRLVRAHLKVDGIDLIEAASALRDKHRAKIDEFLNSDAYRTPQRKEFCIDWGS